MEDLKHPFLFRCILLPRSTSMNWSSCSFSYSKISEHIIPNGFATLFVMFLSLAFQCELWISGENMNIVTYMYMNRKFKPEIISMFTGHVVLNRDINKTVYSLSVS